MAKRKRKLEEEPLRPQPGPQEMAMNAKADVIWFGEVSAAL